MSWYCGGGFLLIGNNKGRTGGRYLGRRESEIHEHLWVLKKRKILPYVSS
jgi:hypothetical protein